MKRLNEELEESIADRAGQLSALVEELRENERSLRESEERFRKSFERSGVGTTHVGLDDRCLMVNCKLCDTWGYTYGELQKLAFQDVTHRDDLKMNMGSGVSAALRGDRGRLYRHALQKKERRVSVGVLERLFGAKGVGRALVLHLGDRGYR